MYSSLITPKIANEHLDNSNWRFSRLPLCINRTRAKNKPSFTLSHLPGATYAHVNRDLAVPHIPGKTGRHPLPEKERLIKLFSTWGH